MVEPSNGTFCCNRFTLLAKSGLVFTTAYCMLPFSPQEGGERAIPPLQATEHGAGETDAGEADARKPAEVGAHSARNKKIILARNVSALRIRKN